MELPVLNAAVVRSRAMPFRMEGMQEAAEAPRKTRPHLPFLDGIRALAALYVVVHHAGMYLRTPGAPTLAPFLEYGHYAVDVFIVLSGFSLMLPVALFGSLKGGARRFLARRARRILPPYLFALALSALLGTTLIAQRTGTFWDLSLPVGLEGLLAHLVLIQDLMPRFDHVVSYPLWSVSVESHIYLLFPLIVLAFARFRGGAVALALIAFGYAVQLLLVPTKVDNGPTGASPYYLGLFGLGCLAARLTVARADRLRWYPLAAVGAAVAGGVVCGRLWTRLLGGPMPEQASSLFVGIATMAVLLALGAEQWPIARRALSWRPLASIGTFAYSVYLVHAPILQLVWQYGIVPRGLHDRDALLALAVVATPLVVLLSWLFSLAFERPFIPRAPAAERLAAP